MLQMIIVVLIGIAVVKFFQWFGGDNSGEPWDFGE